VRRRQRWSLRVLLSCHFVDCLAEAGCPADRPGERRWMGPSVVRVSADPGNPADLGMSACRMPLWNRYATTRADLTSSTASTAVCYRKGSPNMTTDTSTLPRRALVERDDSATPTRRKSPLGTDRRRRPAARPPRTKPGGGHLLRLLLLDESRQPASDPLLLIGPNGGPLWTSRIR
jgi:hypothetical protein